MKTELVNYRGGRSGTSFDELGSKKYIILCYYLKDSRDSFGKSRDIDLRKSTNTYYLD